MSQNVPQFTPNRTQQRALAARLIAEECGISLPTLGRWKIEASFQQEVERLKRAFRRGAERAAERKGFSVMARLIELANMSPAETDDDTLGQLRACWMIAAIRGNAVEPPPIETEIYRSVKINEGCGVKKSDTTLPTDQEGGQARDGHYVAPTQEPLTQEPVKTANSVARAQRAEQPEPTAQLPAPRNGAQRRHIADPTDWRSRLEQE